MPRIPLYLACIVGWSLFLGGLFNVYGQNSTERNEVRKVLKKELVPWGTVPLTGEAERAFLKRIKAERLSEREAVPSFVHTDYSEVQTFKKLGSSLDGENILLSATIFAPHAKKRKKLYFYENASQSVTVTTHENPNNFYKALDDGIAQYNIAISLEAESISGTYHVMNQLPLRVITEAKPLRDRTSAIMRRRPVSAADFYELSIQLEARHRRYQVALLRFEENLLNPPRLERIFYAPLSYVLAFIVSYRYYQETRLVIKEKLIFCDAKRLILSDQFEVLRKNDYRLSEVQQRTIIQKWLAPDLYTQAYHVSFYLLNGTQIERVLTPALVDQAKTLQTLDDLRTVLP